MTEEETKFDKRIELLWELKWLIGVLVFLIAGTSNALILMTSNSIYVMDALFLVALFCSIMWNRDINKTLANNETRKTK